MKRETKKESVKEVKPKKKMIEHCRSRISFEKFNGKDISVVKKFFDDLYDEYEHEISKGLKVTLTLDNQDIMNRRTTVFGSVITVERQETDEEFDKRIKQEEEARAKAEAEAEKVRKRKEEADKKRQLEILEKERKEFERLRLKFEQQA